MINVYLIGGADGAAGASMMPLSDHKSLKVWEPACNNVVGSAGGPRQRRAGSLRAGPYAVGWNIGGRLW
jgi:hypothetical protein